MSRKRIAFLAALSSFAMLFIPLSVSAAVPTDSYTYWENVGGTRKAVYNKAAYETEVVINSDDIGVENFSELADITSDSDGNTYILDKKSRIVILNADHRLVKEIGLIGDAGNYDGAQGIYVHNDGTLFICDTENKRIIHSDTQGKLIETIGLPESKLISDDFNFKPQAVAVDKYGYMYVLSDGSYRGALLYSPQREFLGFFGANEVEISVSAVLSNIVGRIFPNNEKKSNSVRKLPYCFTDLTIDNEGFIYTCNGYTKSGSRTGQIRKLSRGMGTNILNSSSVNFIDEKQSTTKYRSYSNQNLCDVEVDSGGFIYALESKYGKIFMYDSSCRVISVFGGGMGDGTQNGTFKYPVSIALKNDGEEILVADSKTNLITVFKITEYGRNIKKLTAMTLNGHYSDAKKGWQEVLNEDVNFQPAYSGLANAYIGEQDYKSAMQCAKNGYDKETYAIAFGFRRTEIINKYFPVIFVCAFVLIIGVIAVFVYTAKHNVSIIKNKQLKLMLAASVHPANCFAEIKEKGQGSLVISAVLAAAFYIITVLQNLASGFMFSEGSSAAFNSLWAFVRTVGAVGLFAVSNWMVCSLTEGKGRFKEIVIVTCYSLFPVIVGKLLRLILTHFLLPDEASFIHILDAVIILYFALMMISALTKIHEYGVAKLIGTTALTLFAMLSVVFLAVLVFILAQQFYGFIVTVVSELLII